MSLEWHWSRKILGEWINSWKCQSKICNQISIIITPYQDLWEIWAALHLKNDQMYFDHYHKKKHIANEQKIHAVIKYIRFLALCAKRQVKRMYCLCTLCGANCIKKTISGVGWGVAENYYQKQKKSFPLWYSVFIVIEQVIMNYDTFNITLFPIMVWEILSHGYSIILWNVVQLMAKVLTSEV